MFWHFDLAFTRCVYTVKFRAHGNLITGVSASDTSMDPCKVGPSNL